MEKFTCYTGLVAPLDISNIDTDAIIPKQFLQKITKSGFGKHLFHNWRYLDNLGRIENPDFSLNQNFYKNSTILLSRENFGCGSSREHAVWALLEYGFKVILSSSFSDIFYNNSIKNGLLPVVLSKNLIDHLFNLVLKFHRIFVTVNLIENKILIDNKHHTFEINHFHKCCMLNGLDDIDLTLKHIEKIKYYESRIPKFLSPFN
ncbi:isopropylmalate isomerase [Buchnera aphidicola (Schlechtendalia chinensis)]|uniref:3-isopropylmalate dehydratase small subunit n=1 Tax=Buchnera aphidicola subsp. Schlechtendalia chinensis TaxID=118110 RepID=A0A172WE36_BUCSC|nr:3-isopropylmalate dehydratase small subunit [Buchnera aphidicola]ANF17250.1 isopropylmalate isomerase [Buchnera aphidicola (Schlechtendalia chinensis)]